MEVARACDISVSLYPRSVRLIPRRVSILLIAEYLTLIQLWQADRLWTVPTLPADALPADQMENRRRGGPRPGAASVGHGPWVGDTGAHVQSLTEPQGPIKVTFASLQEPSP